MKTLSTVLMLLTTLFFQGCDDSHETDSVTNEPTTLTELQKYSLAFMWHEEKLAHDIYLAFDAINPSTTLKNIATKAEVEHMAIMENLVIQYDINITNLNNFKVNYSEDELRSIPAGTFVVPAIQELYDNLYAEGNISLVASYQTACKVEVIDINDLNDEIITAADNQGLIDAFILLRAGSYKHYWAFDGALKGVGVTDGCCSLGETYCKTEAEYPR